MLASAVEIIVHIFSAAFLVGAVGCVFVIPLVALSLFSVLFEADANGDEEPDLDPANIELQIPRR